MQDPRLPASDRSSGAPASHRRPPTALSLSLLLFLSFSPKLGDMKMGFKVEWKGF